MFAKKKILWIEDDASYNLQRFATPIVMDSKYDLTLAITVSEALHFMQKQKFDVFIFDLRMPPGTRGGWVNLDRKLAENNEPPRLGLYLLLNLIPNDSLKKEKRVKLPEYLNRPAIEQCGILSVDPYSAVLEKLKNINFKPANYKQKKAGMVTNTLHKLVEDILLS